MKPPSWVIPGSLSNTTSGVPNAFLSASKTTPSSELARGPGVTSPGSWPSKPTLSTSGPEYGNSVKIPMVSRTVPSTGT